MQYRFYNQNISVPLSLANNTPEWDTSVMGRLHDKSGGTIFIRELPWQSRDADYCWRVVDAYFSQEDSIMTYFRAYDLEGNMLPQATFGVNWPSVKDRISGGFEYQPEYQNRYYVPASNSFPTPNSGGYTVQVLDMKYPSEGVAFGMFKQGDQHQALVISFRLFRLARGYPNDLQGIEIR